MIGILIKEVAEQVHPGVLEMQGSEEMEYFAENMSHEQRIYHFLLRDQFRVSETLELKLRDNLTFRIDSTCLSRTGFQKA